MIFTSSLSFIYILLFIITYNIVIYYFNNKVILNILLIIGSIIILSTITTFGSLSIILLISILVFYGGIFLKKRKNNKRYLSLFIGILILLFLIKNYQIANIEALQRIGLSYILFRLIHFLVDSSDNKIQGYSMIAFLN